MRRLYFWLMKLCAVCALGALCFAQSQPRTLQGTVRDQLGAVIAGAKVRVQGNAFIQSSLTSTNGEFHFDAIPAEPATLIVEAPAFAPFHITLSPELTRIEVAMEVALASQEINVTANRTRITMADTAESGAVS